MLRRRARRRSILAIPHVPIGILRAHATLRDAARFMGATEWRPAPRSPVPNKVLGNGLRELDRFLSVLIDEVAATIDVDEELLVLLRTRRNTANKLRTLRATLGYASPDHSRLRALGRSRDCLFHCGGLVRRADSRTGSSMTMGWPSRSTKTATLQTLQLGSRMSLDRGDIADICRFYDRIADEQLAASHTRPDRTAASRKSVAFLHEYAHIGVAIVACDGL